MMCTDRQRKSSLCKTIWHDDSSGCWSVQSQNGCIYAGHMVEQGILKKKKKKKKISTYQHLQREPIKNDLTYLRNICKMSENIKREGANKNESQEISGNGQKQMASRNQ